MSARELSAADCRQSIDPTSFSFKTTQEVEPVTGVLAQERALAALDFGLSVRQPRFHVVAVGHSGSGRTFSTRSLAADLAKTLPTPDDLLLLPNPARPSEPMALFLPAGQGQGFCDEMGALYGKLVDTLHNTTEGERFKQAQSRVQRKARQAESLLETSLIAQARELGFELARNGDEVELTPLEDAEAAAAPAPADAEAGSDPVAPEETSPAAAEEPEEAEEEAPTSLSQDPIELVKSAVDDFEDSLTAVHEDAEGELRALLKQTLGEGIKGHFLQAKAKHAERSDITAFLNDLEHAVTVQIHRLIDEPRGDEAPQLSRGFVVPTLLTQHKPGSGAPVIEVLHPTLASLFGRSYSPPDEAFPPEPGFAVAGALHEANGGFLILSAGALLKNEILYEQLKACLISGKFIVPDQHQSYYRGTSEELLFPSIPLDVKVILVAGPGLFHELHVADPDFSQLFKIQARFEPTLQLDEAVGTYAAFVAGLARDRGILHHDTEAVAELVYHGLRLAESQHKVTSCLGMIAEVATEASYLAKKGNLSIVGGEAVRQAINNAQRRGSQFRDEMHELLRKGMIRIETRGDIVGQVNAVSVLSDGPVTFGRPCRVTAVVYPGEAGPMNIAREVEMSGPLHAKGVLVLKGFLASRFARDRPLSFSASLVFEQTYEAIDGDSASSSELYALLSAMSGVPIRQDLAVTGSVDQWGSIQPVGGINEKIEAFYDVCLAKGGLTKTQGVLIPAINTEALVLRADVAEAIRDGQFHVFAVARVEDGIELLMRTSAGEETPDGYPEGSVFARVDARLAKFHQALTKRNGH